MRTFTFKKIALLTGVFALFATAGFAQENLQYGRMVQGNTSYGEPAEYKFDTDEAGVITVILKGDSDFALVVTDVDGQVIGGGRNGGEGDQDINGDTGLEIMTATIPGKGDYVLQVVDQSENSDASYELSANFAEFPAFAMNDDDGRPSQANNLTLGQASGFTTLNTSEGDKYDWYVVEAPSAGSIVVVTRPAEGESLDLILEAFYEGEYTESIDRSDQDLQDNLGNETLMINVEAGEKVYFRVSGNGSVSGEYKVSSVFMN